MALQDLQSDYIATSWIPERILRYGPLLPPVLGVPKPGDLRVTFFGVSTLLFEDGENSILTDGFFSRPSRPRVIFGRIKPDNFVIDQALQKAGVRKLDALIVTHSHYDHAMDCAQVANRTGATIYGSSSTANIARGGGVPENKVVIPADGETRNIGRFRITFVHTKHAPSLFLGGTIDKPLVPPVRATRYKEGQCYAVHLQHGDKSMLVQSSAGMPGPSLRPLRANVAFLGVGLLGKQPARFREAYWQQTVGTIAAKRIIPIHWDDFTRPLTKPMRMMSGLFEDTNSAMRFVTRKAKDNQVQLRIAPALTAFDPFNEL